MNILILGANGFIGTNLAIKLAYNNNYKIVLFDKDKIKLDYLANNVETICGIFDFNYDFISLTKGIDVIYHLISTTNQSNTNINIDNELYFNINVTNNLLEACVKNGVRKIIYLSSGGTVYGIAQKIPIPESHVLLPISTYGIQKVTIEKLLHLYYYLYNLDYRVIRLSNPYGPYQNPNGNLGVVTTYIYKALNEQILQVYGDGKIVRDYIYVDDVISGILNISENDCEFKVFNLGCGIGYSINDVIENICMVLGTNVKIEHINRRNIDVPINILDVNLYEKIYGKVQSISFLEGISKTVDHMVKNKMISQRNLSRKR